MSRSGVSHDPNVDFKLIIANVSAQYVLGHVFSLMTSHRNQLPENVCRLPPEVGFKPVKDLLRRVVDYPDNMRLDVGDKAICPFRDKRDALDAQSKNLAEYAKTKPC